MLHKTSNIHEQQQKKDVMSCHTVNVGVIVVVIWFSLNDDDDDIHDEIFFPENSIYLRRNSIVIRDWKAE